jgi:hypothetical protein
MRAAAIGCAVVIGISIPLKNWALIAFVLLLLLLVGFVAHKRKGKKK